MDDPILERRVASLVRDVLDAESGPHPSWADSPAARRIAERGVNARRLRPGSLRLLALAAVLAIGGAAAAGAGVLMRTNERMPVATPAPAVPASPTPAPPAVAGAFMGAIAYVMDGSVVVERPGEAPFGLGRAGVTQSCPQFISVDELAYAEYDESELEDPETPSWSVMVVGLGRTGNYVERRHFNIDVRPDPDTACFEMAPDASRLAYTVLLGEAAIFSIASDRQNGMVLNVDRDNPPVVPDFMRWTPDGSEVAMVASIDKAGEARNAYSEVWVGAPGMPGTHVLFETRPNEIINDLAWSPDGSAIAYRGTRFTAEGEPSAFVRVMTLGSVQQTIEIDELTDPEIPLSAGPAWSSAGDQLAWVLGGELRVGDRDGSGWRALPPVSSDVLGLGWASDPVIWSADGSHILVGQLDAPLFDRGVESSLVIYDPSSEGQPTGFQPWRPGGFGRVTWQGGSQ